MTCGLSFLAWRILQALINKLTIKVFKVLVKEVDKNEKFLHFCSPTPKTANLAVMDKVNSWFYMFSNQNPLFKILYHYILRLFLLQTLNLQHKQIILPYSPSIVNLILNNLLIFT